MDGGSDSPVLSVRNVRKYFGGIKAVDGVSIGVEPKTITGLIGPNGAGKTTLFNVISGYYKPDSGEVYFKGERIDGLSLHETFKKGLCRTFQLSRELKLMTVLENLMLPPPYQMGENLLKTWFLPSRVGGQEGELREKAMDVLDTLGLLRLKGEYAGNISGGEKRLLELGRTMMAEPDVVLLDEIAAGVSPTERGVVADHIRRLVDERGITAFVVGHEMDFIMDLCDPVIVMDKGRVLIEGSPEEVSSDPRVLEAYLGGG